MGSTFKCHTRTVRTSIDDDGRKTINPILNGVDIYIYILLLYLLIALASSSHIYNNSFNIQTNYKKKKTAAVALKKSGLYICTYAYRGYCILFWLKSNTASWHGFRCEQIVFARVLIKSNNGHND